MVGHDLIPLYQPEFCTSAAFVSYLRVLRVVDRISCVSEFSRSQFEKFVGSVTRSVSRKVVVAAHPLAGDVVPPDAMSSDPQTDEVMVLSVGTLEPRKNQIGVLRAARLLWDRGVRFKLIFAGNAGWLYEPFLDELESARRAGYAAEFVPGPGDAQLFDLYRRCRFTVFCSFSEGFGLPVVESLAVGKPCL